MTEFSGSPAPVGGGPEPAGTGQASGHRIGCDGSQVAGSARHQAQEIFWFRPFSFGR